MPRSLKQIPDARIWSPEECAARLNKSVPWFYHHKRRLEQLGMPKKDGTLGGWDSKAFEAWLDRRAGLMSNIHGSPMVDSHIESQMLEAIRGNY